MYRKIFLWVILCILAFIPLLWLKPGYVDIGGDSSRLYFYDPINYLKSFSLYTVSPNGFNTEGNGSYLIPFTLFLALLKFFFSSPYIITTLINSLTLVAAFFSIFGIITMFLSPYVHQNRDRLNVYFAAVATGVFYTFSPALLSLGWWTAALSTHNQYFLNPLMFFLLLRYITKKDFTYMLLFLLISFIFSPNFFLSPYFFAFYPLAIIFLLIYAITIVHIRLNIKEIAIALCLYLLIHSVHLFRYIFDLFQVNSGTYQLVFSEVGKIDRGLGYFLSVEATTKILNNLLGNEQGILIEGVHLSWFLIPGIVLIGLLLVNKVSKDWQISRTLSLSLIFFFITFYLATAKITYGSLGLYKFLFNVPGFGMFRNYVGQFTHVYIFFYSLGFGISIFYLFVYIRKFYMKLFLLVTLIIIFITSAIPFIRGDAINIVLNPGSKEEIKTPILMDPEYEHVLSSIRGSSFDGKYFLFPMDDSGAQVLHGKDGGYIGPPTIAYLTGKSVFSGLGGLGEFYQPFMNMVMNKDYKGIDNMLSMLNVKYLFFNSDKKIYGDNFSGYPYSRARTIMPLTIDLYKDFFASLDVNKSINLGNSGTYQLYEVSKTNYRPHIYIAKKKYLYDGASSLAFYPLPFREIDNRIALFSTNDIRKQSINESDGSYLEAKRESNLLDSLEKQDALPVTDSVPIQIYTLLHPLLVISEKTSADQANKLFNASFDKNVHSASKIIKDIENYSNKETIDTIFLEKEMKQYVKSMIIVVGMINDKDTIYAPVVYMVKLNKILVSDQNVMYDMVEHNKLSEKEKQNVSSVIEKAFSDIRRFMHADASVSRVVTYMINPSDNGTYNLYLEKQTVFDNQTRNMSIEIEGKSLESRIFEADDYWINMGKFAIQKGKNIKLNFTIVDNIDFAQNLLGMSLKDLQGASYSASLQAKGALLSSISSIIGNVISWEPKTTYIISFEFKIKNTIDSWKQYKVIVETGDNAAEARVIIINNQSRVSDRIENFNNVNDINIRNVAIVSYSWPKVILKKQENQTKKSLPSITFTKINPTKYVVQVRGARTPYTLVLSDIFNQNWKVFLRGEEKKNNDEIIESYYSGGVNEGKHRNEFLNAQTFETLQKKPIAEQKHTQVNVYANAWDISPSDVDGKTDYTLVIELTSQQTLYILLFISLTAVTICLLWIVVLFVLKRKKIL